jgi:hypothetical protein
MAVPQFSISISGNYFTLPVPGTLEVDNPGQLPDGSNFRAFHYPALYRQCIIHEKIGRSQL